MNNENEHQIQTKHGSFVGCLDGDNLIVLYVSGNKKRKSGSECFRIIGNDHLCRSYGEFGCCFVNWAHNQSTFYQSS